MNSRLLFRAFTPFILVAACVLAVDQRAALAQTAPAAAVTPVMEVRQMVAAARKEIDAYRAAGGAATAADHPALKWDATFWEYRGRAPQTDAGALAAVEAIRLLGRAELWDRAHARIESLGADDLAWERVPSVIYEQGIARKDLPAAIARLSKAAASTTSPTINASALLTLGRAYRRQGDSPAATRALEAARSAAPGSTYATQADDVIYEIAYLSIGLQAPAISTKDRNGRPVDLAAYRGRPVVLVFWGST